jgi:hypothetical protein
MLTVSCERIIVLSEKVPNHCRKNRGWLFGIFTWRAWMWLDRNNERRSRAQHSRAIELHLEDLRLEGYELPEPTTYS